MKCIKVFLKKTTEDDIINYQKLESENYIDYEDKVVTSEVPSTSGISSTEKTFEWETSVTGIESGVPEISGLCYNANKTALYAVSDTTSESEPYPGGIYEYNLDTKTTRKVLDLNYDCEGVTLGGDGKLYVCVEGWGKENPKGQSIIEINDGEIKFHQIDNILTEPNKGFEGIEWWKDDLVFVGNQKNPVRLFLYSLNQEKIVWQEDLDIPEIADLSISDGKLFILESKTGKIFQYILGTDYTKENFLIPTNIIYQLPDPISTSVVGMFEEGKADIENPEGLQVDLGEKKIYVSVEKDNKIYELDILDSWKVSMESIEKVPVEKTRPVSKDFSMGRFTVTALSNEEEDDSIKTNDFALIMQMLRLSDKPKIDEGSTSFPYVFSMNF